MRSENRIHGGLLGSMTAPPTSLGDSIGAQREREVLERKKTADGIH